MCVRGHQTRLVLAKRAVIAGLTMGIVGAVIGGFLASASTITTVVYGGSLDYSLFPLGAVPGPISCFLASLWYLKSVQNAQLTITEHSDVRGGYFELPC